MSNSRDLVTIVIPVYNGADFLAAALDSAIAQTWPELEIIVVDDGSDDGGMTAAVAARYLPRIRYIHKENGGVATALNRGIAEMRGKWFSWLSHDDLYHPRKIEEQLAVAQAHSEPALVFSDFDVFTRPGEVLHTVSHDHAAVSREPLWSMLEGKIHGCTMFIPRVAFATCGVFDERRPTTQDAELWFRLVQAYPLLHVPQVLVHSRAHDAQGSRALRHLDEAGLLWLEMIDRMPPETMVKLSGSEAGFIRRMYAFVMITHYFAARAGIPAKYPDVDAEVRNPLASLQGFQRLLRRLAFSPASVPILALAEGLARIPRLTRQVCAATESLFCVQGRIASAWYTAQYPKARGRQPVIDYLRRGWRAGRDPAPDFSGARYLAMYPFARHRWMSPLSHSVLTKRHAPHLSEPSRSSPGQPNIVVIRDGSPTAARLDRSIKRLIGKITANPANAEGTAQSVLLIAGEPTATTAALAAAEDHQVPLATYLLARPSGTPPGDRIYAPNRYAAAFYPDAEIVPPPEVAPVDSLSAWQRRILPGEPVRVVIFRGFDPRPLPPIVRDVARLARRRSKDRIELHVIGGPPISERGLIHHGQPGDELLVLLVCGIGGHVAWLPDHPPEFHSYDLSDAMLCGLPVVAPAVGSFVERLEQRGYAVLYPPEADASELIDIFATARRPGAFKPPAGPAVTHGLARWREILGPAGPPRDGLDAPGA